MRPLAAAAVLAVAVAVALPAPPAAAEDAPTLRLEVGEESPDLGVMPRCDDLTVVAVKASGRGVRGLRPGATTCSFDTSGGGGIRRVLRVVVHAPAPKEAPAGAAKEAPPRG